MDIVVVDMHSNKPTGLHVTPISQEFGPGAVSVIMPTYNRAVFLPKAMGSVRERTYRPAELLVVGDGSDFSHA